MNTHKITTPIGSHEVEIRDWITGRQAEYIDELAYEAVAVKADLSGKAEMGNIDLKKIITETNHRKIETFIVSVDAITDGNILDNVLSMHEQDTQFILDHIDDQRKKK
jgi:hypothetical protein